MQAASTIDAPHAALYAAMFTAAVTLLTATLTNVVTSWQSRKTQKLQHSHDRAMIERQHHLTDGVQRRTRREDAYVDYLTAADELTQSSALAQYRQATPSIANLSPPGDEQVLNHLQALTLRVQRVRVTAPISVVRAMNAHWFLLSKCVANPGEKLEPQVKAARIELLRAIRTDLSVLEGDESTDLQVDLAKAEDTARMRGPD
jgi:hypothetical protein